MVLVTPGTLKHVQVICVWLQSNHHRQQTNIQICLQARCSFHCPTSVGQSTHIHCIFMAIFPGEPPMASCPLNSPPFIPNCTFFGTGLNFLSRFQCSRFLMQSETLEVFSHCPLASLHQFCDCHNYWNSNLQFGWVPTILFVVGKWGCQRGTTKNETLGCCRILRVVSRWVHGARQDCARSVDGAPVCQRRRCRRYVLGDDVPNRRYQVLDAVGRARAFSAQIPQHCGLRAQTVPRRRRLEEILPWLYAVHVALNPCQCYDAARAREESPVFESVSVIENVGIKCRTALH